MADTELAPAEELEPDVVPDGGDVDPNVNDNEPDPIEALASEMGWVPQDKFRGDPNEWRPAKDYIVKGREINQSLSRELRSVKDEVGRISRTSAQLAEDIANRTRAERDQYWQGIHARAVEEGDNATASRAVTELRKLDQQPQPQAPSAPPSEVQSWVQRNPWFNEDPIAQVRAQELSNKLAHLPVDEQLRQVERAIRREFPEHFPAPAKPPAGVQTGGTRTVQTGNRAKGFNDMPAAAQEMARDYERRHGIKPEEFAKSYWADQAKSRRVG